MGLIAQLIYDRPHRSRTPQAQLARLVGTKQPVISQLEDADYEGHSLSMLRRIAEARANGWRFASLMKSDGSRRELQSTATGAR